MRAPGMEDPCKGQGTSPKYMEIPWRNQPIKSTFLHPKDIFRLFDLWYNLK